MSKSIRPVWTMARLGVLAALATWSVSASGCEEKGRLKFEIVTPEGYDPFEGVTSVTIRAGEKEKTTDISGAGDSFELKIDLTLGTETRVELFGTDSGGQVIASGVTPPLYIVGSSQLLRLWVSRVSQLSRHPQPVNASAGQLALAHYVVEDWDDDEDDRLFTFWFGGCNAAGLPVDVAGYYDPYTHEVLALSEMGSSDAWSDPLKPVAARCGSAGMFVDSGMFLVFGGTDETGMPSDELTLVSPSTEGYRYWPIPLECGDGLDNDEDGLTDEADDDCTSDRDATEGPGKDWTRTHAQPVTLGPYPSLWDGTDYRVLNSYLITGGWNLSGRAPTALHVLAELSAGGSSYRYRVEELDLLAARAAHTATMTLIRDSELELRTVLLYGGTEEATDVPVAESLKFELDPADPDLNWTWEQVEYFEDDQQNPLPRLVGHAAVALKDGNILIVGGRDPTSTATADGFLFSTRQGTFQRLPGLLPEPRTGHSATRAGDAILVAGGYDGTGNLAHQAYVLKVDSLTGLVEYRLSTPIGTSRWGHAAFALANDQIMVAGGFNDQNQPIDSIEIFNPE